MIVARQRVEQDGLSTHASGGRRTRLRETSQKTNHTNQVWCSTLADFFSTLLVLIRVRWERRLAVGL